MSNITHISNQVEADRARLAQSLEALTDTVNPQNMVQEATTAANSIAGDLSQKAWGTLRENPAGGLLVTIGLGLLATGSQRSAVSPTPSEPSAVAPAVDPDDALAGFDERVQKADAEMRADMSGQIAPAPQVSTLKAALNSGLDRLPPKARKKVLKARQAAIAAQEDIERQTRRAARKANSFVQEQPLAAGAIALGFGLLAGSLLRGTRREDELLGKRRDALLSQAHDVLQDELMKAGFQAESAVADKTATL